MFLKAIRLQEARARLARAQSDVHALGVRLREMPESEELRASYRLKLADVEAAREHLAAVLAESGERTGRDLDSETLPPAQRPN